ncbi:MAG: sigma factor-like helix-turn-helix DNA-binding protein [Candidatus Colwellbacteria bacterium]|nr:sigma factor-like helix-turn-helix DNA-binding protein [Candidatus Colwellbacteria bacterium]
MSKVIVEIDIDGLIKKALQIQDSRAKDIVVRRHGLKTSKRQTLASLGSEYGLTRERVRQIEAASLRNIKSKIEEEKEAREFIKFTEDYLEKVSKLRRSDLLARDIWVLCGLSDNYDPIFENKLNFIAKTLGRPYVIDATPGLHTIWHIDEGAYGLALMLVRKLLSIKEHSFDKFLESVIGEHKLTESVILNYLSVSKNFGVGPFGDIGADSWAQVNPRTVRDKAYLVLSQTDAPMHFREIAKLVNEISRKGKAPATVHNELIRDPRFTLVSRGTYSLNERAS